MNSVKTAPITFQFYFKALSLEKNSLNSKCY